MSGFEFYFVSGILKFGSSTNGSSWNISLTDTVAINDDSWHHVAIVRNGDIFSLYRDGTLAANTTVAGSITSATGTLRIGYNNSGSYDYLGYFDELRITKGKARWTSDFTVPA